MALGFKKPTSRTAENLGVLGGMGLAAIGGPIAPLIMATLYGAQKEGQRDDEATAQREQAMQDFIGKKGGAGFDPSTGVNWNQDRPGFQQEQMGRLAQFAPEVAVNQRMSEMFPAPEKFGNPQEVMGPDGQPTFMAFGDRGGMMPFEGARPITKPDPVELVNAFDLKTNRPIGAINKRAFDRLASEQPGRYQVMGNDLPGSGATKGIGEMYRAEVGGTIPEGLRPQRTAQGWTLVPLEGGPKDPAIIEQNRLKSLEAKLPEAETALISTLMPLRRMVELAGEVKKDPNTRDVVGAWEGGENKWRINPFTAQGNATAAARIKNLSDLAENIGIQMMRDASKTGGAVGSVTEREWPKLSARIANLSTLQGEESFNNEMTSIEQDIGNLVRQIEGAFQQEYAQVLKNRQTGQGQTSSAPSPAAVMALQANPGRAAEFDAKYGQGASEQYLKNLMGRLPPGGV